MEGVRLPVECVDVSSARNRTVAWTLVHQTLPLASLTQAASKMIRLLNNWHLKQLASDNILNY